MWKYHMVAQVAKKILIQHFNTVFLVERNYMYYYTAFVCMWDSTVDTDLKI